MWSLYDQPPNLMLGSPKIKVFNVKFVWPTTKLNVGFTKNKGVECEVCMTNQHWHHNFALLSLSLICTICWQYNLYTNPRILYNWYLIINCSHNPINWFHWCHHPLIFTPGPRTTKLCFKIELQNTASSTSNNTSSSSRHSRKKHFSEIEVSLCLLSIFKTHSKLSLVFLPCICVKILSNWSIWLTSIWLTSIWLTSAIVVAPMSFHFNFSCCLVLRPHHLTNYTLTV